MDGYGKCCGEVFGVLGLSKLLDGRRALSGITFSVGRREVFGILGPTGAGKTTLARHLVGFSEAETGRVEFFGRHVLMPSHWMRRHIGYMPQSVGALSHSTCEQALYLTARIRGLSRKEARRSADTQLDLWEISDLRDQDSRSLSGGEARLLRLGVTMIGEPEVLVLDEPTAHLDGRYRRQVHRVLAHLAATTTIVIVTHDVSDAVPIFDRLALISGGRLQAVGRPSDLWQADCRRITVRLKSADPAMHSFLLDLGLQPIDDEQWTGVVSRRALESISDLCPGSPVITFDHDPAFANIAELEALTG